MGRSIALQVISFVILALIQVLLMKHVSILSVAFCFIYISFLISIPLNIDRVFQLLLAFAMGISIDLFYDSLGIHAAASVLFMFLRQPLINVLPRKTDDFIYSISLSRIGFQRFAVLCLPLIFIHHFTLFFIELGNWSFFFSTLMKIVGSTFFSFIGIYIVQFLFSRSRNREFI